MTKMRVNLSEMFMIDFFGAVLRTLSFIGMNKADGGLKVSSIVVALMFLGMFTYEFLFQFHTIPRLSQKDQNSLSKLEKALY